MSRSKVILILATAALVISAVVLLMHGRPVSATQENGDQARNQSPSSRAARSSSGSQPEGPAARDPRPEPTHTLEQISSWLADDSVSTDEAATRLWRVFADTRQTKDVRKEALGHALNLTSDKRLVAEFLPVYAQPGLWSGEIGEAALDELYNRGKEAKLAAGAALLGHATGEFHDQIRDLLRFELDEPDADDAALIRKAHEKPAAKPDS
ncbi:MAG: hypothetical protein QM755_06575 [Luteolibacter sp.]